MPRWGTKKTKLQKKRVIFIGFIIFLLMMFQTFLYIEHNLEPILISIAKARVKQIATNAVNDAISKKIAQNTNFKDLIQFEKDDQGKIRAAIFNYSEFARIVGEATARVEDTLNHLATLEEKIKLGAAFNSDIFANLGPDIPIALVPIGSVQVNPYPVYQNAGINVVIMTVMMDIRAEVQVVIPFVTEPTVIQTTIPIAQTQIFGEVPQFYYDGHGTYYNTNSGNAQNAPPIQIIPGGTFTPNNNQGQTNQSVIPSSTNNINAIPGLEQFYPLVPRSTIPSMETIQNSG